MNPPEEPQVRTRIFARVLGPFFVIVPVADLVRGTNIYAPNAGGLWEAVYVCLAVTGLYLAHAGWRPAATPESTARQNI